MPDTPESFDTVADDSDPRDDSFTGDGVTHGADAGLTVGDISDVNTPGSAFSSVDSYTYTLPEEGDKRDSEEEMGD